MPCLAAHFQIQAFLLGNELCFLSFIRWRSTMCLKPESGSVHFETTIESHVALEANGVIQKWNSYRFVSRPYRGLLSNLPKKFRGAKFSWYRTNPRKPRKCASNIWCYTVYSSCLTRLISSCATEGSMWLQGLCSYVASKYNHAATYGCHKSLQTRGMKIVTAEWMLIIP